MAESMKILSISEASVIIVLCALDTHIFGRAGNQSLS